MYIENQYAPDQEEPNTSTAGTMVGSYSAWANGYTGAGSRIAIIDTGLDLDHPSFDEECYLYGLDLSAARFGKNVEDYNLLTAGEVAGFSPSSMQRNFTAVLPRGALPLRQGSLRLQLHRRGSGCHPRQ